MVHRKIAYPLILGICLLLCACKKDKYISVTSKMAHTGEPVGGSQYLITENKSSIGSSGYTETNRWEGTIPESGAMIISYEFKNNRQYFMSFDHSSMNVPSGDYAIVKGPVDLVGNIGSVKNIDIRVLPYMEVTIHYKNVDCYDANDQFKFKYYNTDEYPYYSQGQINSIPWFEGTAYSGCLNMNWNGIYYAGHYVFYWEATRNGILETGIDTFYVAPGVNDLIEMFW